MSCSSYRCGKANTQVISPLLNIQHSIAHGNLLILQFSLFLLMIFTF